MKKTEMVIEPSDDGSSVFIDIITDFVIGRLTIRSRGVCDTEIMYRQSTEQIYYKYDEFRSREELRNIIVRFASELHKPQENALSNLLGDSSFEISFSDSQVGISDIINDFLHSKCL